MEKIIETIEKDESYMIWRIGELLIQKKLISWEQLENALIEQKKTKGFIGDILISKKYIAPALFYKSLADRHSMRFVDLKRTKINRKAVELIPQSVAEKHRLMPLEIVRDSLVIGISNPLAACPAEELKGFSRVKEIRTVLCIPEDIQNAINENYTRHTAQVPPSPFR